MAQPLDLDQLRTFVAIAETGSFTRAAGTVSKTQSAVSMQMRRLEERIGKPIFMREGRAKLYRSSGGPKARDQILGVVGDGSVLGLGAALEGRPQSQGAAALTDCVLYALFRDDLI